jgi:hypothetical protein
MSAMEMVKRDMEASGASAEEIARVMDKMIDDQNWLLWMRRENLNQWASGMMKKGLQD